jgi:hypothetical protein
MKPRYRSTIYLIAVVWVLTACSAGNLLTTGQSIDALGQQFLTVGNQIRAAKAAGSISDADYAKWTGFVAQFKVGFPQAETAWQTAYKAGDLNAPGATVDLVITLKNQLVDFLLLGVKP